MKFLKPIDGASFAHRPMPRPWRALIRVGAATLALGALPPHHPARALSSEDVLKGPFHHERVTERAANSIGVLQQGSFGTRVPLGSIPGLSTPSGGRKVTEQPKIGDKSVVRPLPRPLGRPQFRVNPLIQAPQDYGSMSQTLGGALKTPAEWQFSGTYSDQTSLDPDSSDALNTLGWHADYIDSYLYSPLWWAQGDLLPNPRRFKAALATKDELEKLHFDDLRSPDQVHYMWRRYTSGALAGLIWAKEKNDVHAAQCIVGVSLHAMQDFYAHSNWVDDPNRRDKTYFQVGSSALGNFLNTNRSDLALYTGAYELPGRFGAAHHGKLVADCSIMRQPGVSQLLGAACSVVSPLTGGPMCQTYDACKGGTSIQTKVNGATVPKGLMYLAPAGIALDNTWVADLALLQRKLNGSINPVTGKPLTGGELFKTTLDLAERQSAQWLQLLAETMKKLGPDYENFWREVRTKSANRAERTRQYENYGQLPYQFLSAGPYPPQAPGTAWQNDDLKDEEVYLRVKLATSDSTDAGTNADIRASAGGFRDMLLDYSPGRGPILSYNDFTRGDNDVYVLGPFPSLPPRLELRNDAPNAGDVLLALGKTFTDAVGSALGGVVNLGKAIMGTDADFIKESNRVFDPAELASIGPQGKAFTVALNGGDEGYYRLDARIRRTAENADEGWREFEIKFERLYCIRESKWDRGSNSDEPFITALIAPLPGEIQPYRSSITVRRNGKDEEVEIDAGDSVYLNKTFAPVKIFNEYGSLNIPVAAWEHDDETGAARNKILDTFAGQVETKTANVRNGFISSLGGAVGADWKLARIEVTAWNRNGSRVRVGTVLNQGANRWVKGGKSVGFDLNASAFKTYPIAHSSLLPDLSPMGLGNDRMKIPDGMIPNRPDLEIFKPKDGGKTPPIARPDVGPVIRGKPPIFRPR